MKKIIKSVTIVTHVGISKFCVGEKGIVEIEDEGVEWENGIDFIYSAYDKNGNLLEQVINCPVQVEFRRGE